MLRCSILPIEKYLCLMSMPASIATERRQVTDRSGKGDTFGFICAGCRLANSFEMLPPNPKIF